MKGFRNLLRKIWFTNNQMFKINNSVNFKQQFCLTKCATTNILLRNQSSTPKIRGLHDDNDNIENDVEDLSQVDDVGVYEEQPVYTRDLIYPNSTDPIIKKINESTSIQEVLAIVRDNEQSINTEQITQAIVVTWDLLKILYHINGISPIKYHKLGNTFVLQLHANPDFQRMISLTRLQLEYFDVYSLTYVCLSLRKLGFEIKCDLLQLIVQKIIRQLKEDFQVNAASRFLVALFSDPSLQPYFVAQDIVPDVFGFIDTCETATDMKYLSICLSNLHDFITTEVLQKYKLKAEDMIERKVLTGEEYKTIIKMLFFLNYPTWRHENFDLIRKCNYLIKNNISELNANSIIVLNEVFSKNYEPGEILNSIQHYATKLLLELEEESNPDILTRLKLLSIVVANSSTAHRTQFESTVKKYMSENLTTECLFILRRILLMMKTQDKNVCQQLWNKMQELLSEPDCSLLKLCSEYTNFSVDINNYRHLVFEDKLLEALDREDRSYELFPSMLAHTSMFVLPYSKDRHKVNQLLNKICENWEQMSCMDWLKISKGMQLSCDVTNRQSLSQNDVLKINRVFAVYVMNKINQLDVKEINLLLKCCVNMNVLENYVTNSLLMAFESHTKLSSALIRLMVHTLMSTSSFSPVLMNNITEYIKSNGGYILGSTAQKVLLLCYYLGYHPEDSNNFFETCIDTLIRDKERMSGLTYLQAALALCFFNKLPNSFIKQIFNVSFLEKLDAELSVCYSKEKYPLRVRHLMMQLNRAVCLDYPEANIPWFHNKYIDEIKKKRANMKSSEHYFQMNVNQYLLEIVGEPKMLQKDVTVPYGYHTDFVICMNSKDEVVEAGSSAIAKRLAILLAEPYSYTNYMKQMKGDRQLKRRHLEILGYTVAFLDFADWRSLQTGKQKIAFLKKFIWPKIVTKTYAVIDR